MKETVVPMAVFSDDGWKVADRDEFLRPDTSLDGLAALKPAFRAGGRVTAGNSAGLTDGATAAFLASESAAAELGLEPKLRLVSFAYAGVEPHLMGYGPVPATRRALEQAGIGLDDIDVFELNEPFAVQVLTWCDELGIAADDPRLNPYGGAIACGHPLAATGVRLIAQLAYALRERGGRYGLTALCIGMGMGCAIVWERSVSDTVLRAEPRRVARRPDRARHRRQRRGPHEADDARPLRVRVGGARDRRARVRRLGGDGRHRQAVRLLRRRRHRRVHAAALARGRGRGRTRRPRAVRADPRAAVPDRRGDQRSLPRRRPRAGAALRRADDRVERPPLRLSGGGAVDHPGLGRNAARAAAGGTGRGGAADRAQPAAPEQAARRGGRGRARFRRPAARAGRVRGRVAAVRGRPRRVGRHRPRRAGLVRRGDGLPQGAVARRRRGARRDARAVRRARADRGRADVDDRRGLRRRGSRDGRAARQPAGAGRRVRVHRRRAAHEEAARRSPT